MASGFIPDSKAWDFKKRVYKAAIRYTAKKWRVFPCFTAKAHPGGGFRCTCGRPKCNRPAKHPATKDGFKNATTDQRELETLATGTEQNIAVATGSGLLVLDVDPDKGGDESLMELMELHEPLPDTLTCITGGAGIHYYFTIDDNVQCSVNKIGRGLDIRADGGYVLVPPSRHISGREYFWDDGQPYEIAKAPYWLLDLATGTARADSPKAEAVIEGGRNEFLTSFAGTMRRRGASESTIELALQEENEKRCRPPLSKAEVTKIAKSVARYAPSADAGSWQSSLKRNAQGLPYATATNAAIFLSSSDYWRGVLKYDEFADVIRWAGTPPEAPFAPKQGAEFDMEMDVMYVAHWLSKNCGPVFNEDDTLKAVKRVAYRSKYNPLQDYLKGLKWDGKPRVDSWLRDYLDSGKHVSHVGKWFLVAAVARAMQPGCKVDNMMVLEGAEGIGKSTATKLLVPNEEWFSDGLPSLNDKYIGMWMQGKWIIELSELASLNHVTQDKVKKFMSQQVDHLRKPYSKQVLIRPRSCVFVGTTNRDQYLDDDENRRFWPVRCGKVDVDGLLAARDQLWAEAKHLYDDNVKWFPDTNEQAGMASEQGKRVETNIVWEEKISEYLVPRVGGFVSTAELIAHMGITPDRADKKHAMEVGRIMRRLYWRKSQRTLDNGRRVRGWEKGS